MADLKHVKGLSELHKILQQLPAKVEKNVMRGALRAGMKPIRADAQANVPVKSGELRKGLKVSTRSKGGRITARLRATGPHAHLANWIEYGTSAHKIVGPMKFGGKWIESVNHPGTPARPFMRPALDSQATNAVVATGEYIKKRLSTKHGLNAADISIEGDD